jgi:hypothetical protein
MINNTFYADLPASNSLEAVLDDNQFYQLPPDWCLIVTDVKASTDAVLRGEYRQVILLGVATIVTVLNSIEDRFEIPFVFGGDGAVIALPESAADRVLAELAKLKQLASSNFNFKLRVAAFPIHEITQAGHQVLVGRYRLSSSNDLAVFDGGGVQYVETKVKENDIPLPDNVTITPPTRDRLQGLECRWQPLTKTEGMFASLHVRALASGQQQRVQTYKQLWSKLRTIYAAPQLEHPIETSDLKLTITEKDLQAESLALAPSRSWLAQQRYRYWLRVQIILGMLLMYFNINAGGLKWGQYTGQLVNNIDFHSFADGYTRVLPGTISQHQELIDYLDRQCHDGNLVYGLHLTEKALITCHITHYSNQHIHFLDGNDGGLTLAMRQMKWRTLEQTKV